MRLRFPRPSRLQLELLWDAFMVWMAILNLGLIAFDLTYLWARPTYRRFIPSLVHLYDPVKGISPQPLSESLLRLVDDTRRIAALDPAAPTVAEDCATLATLTARVMLENPFERSGQVAAVAVVRRVVASESGVPTVELVDAERVREAARRFWALPPEAVLGRLDLFDRELRPLLLASYYREIDRRGELEDHFWLLDLPFLALFLGEFLARWLLAVRRRTYRHWSLYPLMHWYDAIGVLPGAWFRLFRPLRVVAMVARWRRAGRGFYGADYVSRVVGWFSGIVAEEVSDRVAVIILDELATEIREGTHRRITRATVLPRQGEIEQLLAREVRALLSDAETLSSLHQLCRLQLDGAIERSHALDAVPLPNLVVRPLARSIGEIVLSATFEGVPKTLDSEAGRAALDRVLSAAIGRFLAGEAVATIEALAREITLEVIEEAKATVSVRKWAMGPTRRDVDQL